MNTHTVKVKTIDGQEVEIQLKPISALEYLNIMKKSIVTKFVGNQTIMETDFVEYMKHLVVASIQSPAEFKSAEKLLSKLPPAEFMKLYNTIEEQYKISQSFQAFNSPSGADRQ